MCTWSNRNYLRFYIKEMQEEDKFLKTFSLVKNLPTLAAPEIIQSFVKRSRFIPQL
jgi:hypothetical protein